MREQDPKDRIREMSVLNLIMVIGIAIGFGIGILIENMIGGIAIGMLGAFICRLLYIRKKYKEINLRIRKSRHICCATLFSCHNEEKMNGGISWNNLLKM